MSESLLAVISAIITGTLSLIGVYAANRKNSAVIEVKIEQLEKKVDEHNKLIERTYKLEGQVTELQHEMKDVKGGKAS